MTVSVSYGSAAYTSDSSISIANPGNSSQAVFICLAYDGSSIDSTNVPGVQQDDNLGAGSAFMATYIINPAAYIPTFNWSFVGTFDSAVLVWAVGDNGDTNSVVYRQHTSLSTSPAWSGTGDVPVSVYAIGGNVNVDGSSTISASQTLKVEEQALGTPKAVGAALAEGPNNTSCTWSGSYLPALSPTAVFADTFTPDPEAPDFIVSSNCSPCRSFTDLNSESQDSFQSQPLDVVAFGSRIYGLFEDPGS